MNSEVTAARHLRDLARLEAGGAEIVQEPADQPYGVRDCAVRDPEGTLIRIQSR